MRYVLRENGGISKGFFNSMFQEERQFYAEVEATIFRAQYLKKPVTHFVMSFPEKEKKKALENVTQIAQLFLKKMGYDAALAAYGAHDDTDHFHIHIAVVMADLDRMKSLNQEGVVLELMKATSSLCKAFNFSSPLHDYRMVLLGIKTCFENTDWDIIHETLETMSVQIENNSDTTGYVLKTGRWDVELGAVTGFPSAERYFQQMGPAPFMPKKALPKKPNFWVMKKAAMAVVFKEKRKVTEEFDKRLNLAEMHARCREDEEKAWAEMEVDALEDGRLMARNILHYYSSVIKSITQEAWSQQWKEIESALWDWTINKNRSEECLARLGVTPAKTQPAHALLKMA
jgi:hypothetical protein